MSSTEERLVRDIAAVTRGVIVTEQHLRDARNAVEERIEVGRQSNGRRGVALAAAAAVILPILGFVAFQAINDEDRSSGPVGTPVDPYEDYLVGTDPTVDLVTGVWRQDDGFMLVRFQSDGKVQFNDSGGLYGNPSTTGTYEIEGDNITITTTPGGSDGEACGGTTMSLRASIADAGTMRWVNPGKSGACMLLATDERWTLEQALPTLHEGMASFAPADEPFGPLTRRGVLYGDWLAVGGGHMLELGDDGTYTVAGDHGDVLDSGQWVLSDQELQLTSGQDSPTCDSGDRLVLRRLTHGAANPSEFLRGSVATNMCGGSWAKTVWYLIPNNRGN